MSGDPKKEFDYKAFLEKYGETKRFKRRNKKEERELEAKKK